LGQQVSVRAATTLAGRFVALWGAPIRGGADGLSRVFPSPRAFVHAGVDAVAARGLPRRRATALVELARAVEEGRVRLDPGADPEATARALAELPGIGDWTAQYLTLRALSWPDAFPAGDLVLQRRLGAGSAERAMAVAEEARPYRGYAALHVWVEEARHERRR
jgi:AraC family transcriptional regulator of adaptative response / DNA-3-methyladenine glycosylase II